MERFIHLLYVPTMACNMQCRYCYLGDGTKAIETEHTPLETLAYAVDKCRSEGVMPFNISLHGGEVTTLPKEDFRSVVAYIADYYRTNGSLRWTGTSTRSGITTYRFPAASTCRFPCTARTA